MHVSTYFNKLRDRDVIIVLGQCPSSLSEYFCELGYPVIDYNDFNFSSGGEAFIISNSAKVSDRMVDELWGNHNCIIAHINPWKLYNNSAESQIYTFDRIISSDIDSVLLERRRLREILGNNVQKSLQISSSSADLWAEFVGSVEISNTDDCMKRGWNYSVAEFFEVGLLNFGGNRVTGFQVSGEFKFDGIVAFRSQANEASKEAALKELMLMLDNNTKKHLTVEANIIKKVHIDGLDISELVFRCFGVEGDVGEIYEEAKLKEVAFGCNRIDVNNVKWHHNSIINEGVYGFHLGFGLADRASHIDFVGAGNYNLTW